MSDSQLKYEKKFTIGTSHPLIEDGPFAALSASTDIIENMLIEGINRHIWETETVKGRF
jgi:hypothetical protein